MSRITNITVSFGRTFVPPDGDRYQPIRVDGALTRCVDEGDDPAQVRATLQTELRALLEETFLAQYRNKGANGSAPKQTTAPVAPPPASPAPPAFRAAQPATTPADLADEPLEY